MNKLLITLALALAAASSAHAIDLGKVLSAPARITAMTIEIGTAVAPAILGTALEGL